MTTIRVTHVLAAPPASVWSTTTAGAGAGADRWLPAARPPRRGGAALLVLASAAACGGSPSPASAPVATSPPPVTTAPSAITCPAVSAVQPYPMSAVVVAPPSRPRATMKYLDVGRGPTTFVLLHGIPTSSYEWRNVIPELTALGRVVAPDLVGYGASDRPELAYGLDDHTAYLGAFLDALTLDDVILVVHDLGSVAGLIWASQHPDRVRGLVSIEGLIPDVIPASVAQSPSRCTAGAPDHPACLWMFLRSPAGQTAIVDGNFFVDAALAGEPFCPPSPAALEVYRAAFPTPASRRALAGAPGMIPVDGQPATFAPLLDAYARWLETSAVPKLVLYGEPGFLAPAAVAQRAAARWTSTEAASVGPGVHFLPEVQPVAVGSAIRAWYQRTFAR